VERLWLHSDKTLTILSHTRSSQTVFIGFKHFLVESTSDTRRWRSIYW